MSEDEVHPITFNPGHAESLTKSLPGLMETSGGVVTQGGFMMIEAGVIVKYLKENKATHPHALVEVVKILCEELRNTPSPLSLASYIESDMVELDQKRQSGNSNDVRELEERIERDRLELQQVVKEIPLEILGVRDLVSSQNFERIYQSYLAEYGNIERADSVGRPTGKTNGEYLSELFGSILESMPKIEGQLREVLSKHLHLLEKPV